MASNDTDTDARRFFVANRHRALVEVTGNPSLLELFGDIWLGTRGPALFADFLAHDSEHLAVDKATRAAVGRVPQGIRRQLLRDAQIMSAQVQQDLTQPFAVECGTLASELIAV